MKTAVRRQRGALPWPAETTGDDAQPAVARQG